MLRLFRRAMDVARQTERLQRSQHDILLRMSWAAAARELKNPLKRFGAKFFSQADEDGITLEIIRRLGLKNGTFLELGVGNGLENNTLVLLSIGWHGAWIGGENLAFDPQINPKRLSFKKAWISLDNVPELVKQSLENIAVSDIDVLCMDLDGNDLFLTEKLLGILNPKLVIVEYNARFPPHARWSIKYDPQFTWDETDYHGASLSSFCDLLTRFEYTLVCCAASGVDAFFVRNSFMSEFADVPKDIEEIFVAPRYELPARFGHPVSPKTIEQMLISSTSMVCPAGTVP